MSSWRRALDTWAIRRRTRALRVACRQGRREPGTCLCLLWVAFEEAHQKRPVRRGYGHRWESGASRMGELHHPVEDYGGPLGQGRHPTQGPVAPPAETTLGIKQLTTATAYRSAARWREPGPTSTFL